MSVAAIESEPNATSFPSQEAMGMPLGTYWSVDDLPLLALARQQIRNESEVLVEERRFQLQAGQAENVPLPIDALSMADQVIEARDVYGEQSPQYLEKKQGLLLDCWRALAEWRRKLKPEYFEPVRHVYDADRDDYLSHGRSTDEMTKNALTPLAEPEEVDRRINERVENATPGLLKKLGGIVLDKTIRVRTISECADFAIERYQAGKADNFGGYVPEIEKLVIRDFLFDEESADRFEEQVSLPGRFINHYVIQKALRRRRLETGAMTKTELHGTQILTRDDIVDFVELLDTVASEEWCVDIFMGEELQPGQAKDYSTLREEAYLRQQELVDKAEVLALFTIELAENGTDRKKAPEMVEEFAKRLMINVAYENNDLAYEIFNEKTAEGLREVAQLRNRGQVEEAAQLLAEVIEEAPGGGYCTAGSCGLERILPGSHESRVAKEYGAESDDDAIKDTERTCPECNKTAIIYIISKKLKVCTNCRADKTY